MRVHLVHVQPTGDVVAFVQQHAVPFRPQVASMEDIVRFCQAAAIKTLATGRWCTPRMEIPNGITLPPYPLDDDSVAMLSSSSIAFRIDPRDARFDGLNLPRMLASIGCTPLPVLR